MWDSGSAFSAAFLSQIERVEGIVSLVAFDLAIETRRVSMDKFRGSQDDLMAIIASLGYMGEWSGDGAKVVFRSDDKAVLNWWPSTGTLSVQGPSVARDALKAHLQGALSDSAQPNSSPTPTIGPDPTAAAAVPAGLNTTEQDSKRVFVVYGHDETAKDQLELILRRLELEPFVLGNTAGGGLTIIEALEEEIVHRPEAQRFGIVLLTPDDLGFRRNEHPENAEPRARQNVVMEMGMLIAAFGRTRVAILKKGDVAVPSDASGIIYLAFERHVKETATSLCERLQDAGFELSSTAIVKAAS